MRNIEWLVPVIVFSVFIVGNILRILNWKNEQEKKAATKRPRVFQVPPRQLLAEPVRQANLEVVETDFEVRPISPVDVPPRPIEQRDTPRSVERPKTRPTVSSEDLQRAIRRNRAKAQKRTGAARTAEVAVVLPVEVTASTRTLRDEPAPVAPVIFAAAPSPPLSGAGLPPLIGDLFSSPDAVAKAMVLQVIFSPPPSRRGR
jgi:hypothetical protein